MAAGLSSDLIICCREIRFLSVGAVRRRGQSYYCAVRGKTVKDPGRSYRFALRHSKPGIQEAALTCTCLYRRPDYFVDRIGMRPKFAEPPARTRTACNAAYPSGGAPREYAPSPELEQGQRPSHRMLPARDVDPPRART